MAEKSTSPGRHPALFSFKFVGTATWRIVHQRLLQSGDQGRVDVEAVLRAAACRVANVIRPYLEAIL